MKETTTLQQLDLMGAGLELASLVVKKKVRNDIQFTP
jgi:hypothetical protein